MAAAVAWLNVFRNFIIQIDRKYTHIHRRIVWPWMIVAQIRFNVCWFVCWVDYWIVPAFSRSFCHWSLVPWETRIYLFLFFNKKYSHENILYGSVMTDGAPYAIFVSVSVFVCANNNKMTYGIHDIVWHELMVIDSYRWLIITKNKAPYVIHILMMIINQCVYGYGMIPVFHTFKPLKNIKRIKIKWDILF